MKTAPDGKGKFQSKPNQVGNGNVKPKNKKASSDVTDEVGSKTGTPPIAALQGKNNQVPKSTLKKSASYFQ